MLCILRWALRLGSLSEAWLRVRRMDSLFLLRGRRPSTCGRGCGVLILIIFLEGRFNLFPNNIKQKNRLRNGDKLKNNTTSQRSDHWSIRIHGFTVGGSRFQWNQLEVSGVG